MEQTTARKRTPAGSLPERLNCAQSHMHSTRVDEINAFPASGTGAGPMVTIRTRGRLNFSPARGSGIDGSLRSETAETTYLSPEEALELRRLLDEALADLCRECLGYRVVEIDAGGGATEYRGCSNCGDEPGGDR